MKEAIKDKVVDLLNNYITNQRHIAILRYEMGHPEHITPDEMIDAMSFGHSGDSGPVTGHISNKTLYIALNYQEKMEGMNTDLMESLASQLWKLEQEQERLRFYVSLMDSIDQEIIRLSYFEGKNSEELSLQLGLAPRYVRKRRSAAVSRLCEMYEVASDFRA